MLQPASRRLAVSALRSAGTQPSISSITRRTFLNRASSNPASDDWDLDKIRARRRDHDANRTAFLAAGAVAGFISFGYTLYKIKEKLDEQAAEKKTEDGEKIKLDSQVPTEQFKTEAGEKRKVVLHDEEGNEIVPTGNGTVPTFPRVIDVQVPGARAAKSPIAASINANDGTEFTLVGLGMRSVTFIGINVYLVGFYVATQDVEKLQHYLVKKVNPLATTLIPSEKDVLRKSLKDAAEGEETWDAILRDAGCRSIFRITPVRDTDYPHLRDGFVRAIQERSNRDERYSDEAFGAAVKSFKDIFQRGTVPKKSELLLCRDEVGKLSILAGADSDKKAARENMGTIADERLSRLLWLNYLAGKKVASEPARENIIEGVMEFVERPVGTVATQVV